MAATEYILGSSYSQRKNRRHIHGARPHQERFSSLVPSLLRRDFLPGRDGTISGPVMDYYRETIWGIDPKDRQWFQLLTLIGGTAGSVILTQLEVSHGSAAPNIGPGVEPVTSGVSHGSAAPNQAALNITLGIGASFVASGFIAWGLLQAKELIMAIADWIREATARRRERLIRQAYEQGYADAQQGKPKRPPGDDPGKST